MPVKSLVELATAVVLKNLKELDSVGDFLPYDNVRHILLRVDNAPQLRQIELNSPQIEGEAGEIWLKLIERDFPLEFKAKSYKPPTPKKWYRVWEKYKKDHDQALADSENKLRSALAGLQENKEKNLSRVVGGNRFLPRAGKPPPKHRGPARDTRPSVFDFHGGKRMKLQRGADVMRKVRREANEIAMIHGKLSRPTSGMPQRPQLAQAPPAMINDYRRASQPVFRTKAAEPPSAVTEHEENAEFISDSEEDDYGDDAFEDVQRPASSSRLASKPVKRPTPVARPPPGQAPIRKHASSAAASLLKKRPAQSASSSSSTRVAASPSRPRGTGLLTNSHKPSSSASASSPRPTTTPKPQSVVKSSPLQLPDSPPKTSQYLPRTQTSPPLGASAGPSSPPLPALPLTESPEQPRKRKAVDIFMRPRKRMNK